MNLKCKKIFTGLALSAMVFSSVVSVSAQKTDYAKSKEKFQLQYKGYIQFVGSYCIPEDAGYHLVAGKNVKQAYVNYTRDGKSVTTNGGRLYTSKAKSKTSNTKHTATAYAWDKITLSDDPKYVTKFNYGWIYFK